MPASAPSPSPVTIPHPASLRTRAVAEVRDVLASIGDSCPERPLPDPSGAKPATIQPSNSPKTGELRIGHKRSERRAFRWI
jgi:hypothetical protein